MVLRSCLATGSILNTIYSHSYLEVCIELPNDPKVLLRGWVSSQNNQLGSGHGRLGMFTSRVVVNSAGERSSTPKRIANNSFFPTKHLGLSVMSGLPRPGPPPGKKVPTMRPSSMRPPLNTARGRSATPAHNGRTSPAESVASSRVRSSPAPGTKRKQRDFDQDHGEETNINVVVRCRGRNDREVRENSGVVVSTDGIKGRIVDLSMGPNALSNKTYQFDKVFSPAADQNIIFDEVVAPILDEVCSSGIDNRVLGGFNCTIFAYGQTGTGKTYTMSGDISDILPLPDAAGIIPRVLFSLFNKLESTESENSVKCSFIELYNEELRDLLSADDHVKLKLFEDNNKKGHSSTLVQGMEECHIKTASRGIQLLREGSHKRQVAATKCNDLSSRSHTVFTITVLLKRTTDDGQEYMSSGKLNLVDLAGSENIQRSGAENKRATEAGLINKSLLTLGRVINALVDRGLHIPYRESKLTRLLQDSLGGQTKTCIIATVSPAKSNLEETISTLDYAFRAKNIRNKPQVNQLMSKKTLLKEFTTEIEKLKSELIATRQRNGVYLTQENFEEITTESESRRILSEEQRDKIETMEIHLRNKGQELFSLMTNFQNLKKDNEQAKITLEGTKSILEKTEIVLEHTRQNLAEESMLRKAHQKTEGDLADIGYDMISTLRKTTSDINGLRSKIRRKSDLQSQNRQNWASSQSQVYDTTSLVENRIEQFQAQQELMMNSLSTRMQTFVKDELNKLGASQTFLQEKMKAYNISEQEVNEQTTKACDDVNEVLGEIKTLREEVKERLGAGLNELSVAAEKISENIIIELEAFHTELHSSYSSLGREFKNTFDDLTRCLNEQQDENSQLHLQILNANTALLADEEKQKSVEERQQLLAQITSLINSSAEVQVERMNERISSVSEEISGANAAFNTKQTAYSQGMSAWSDRSKEIVFGVSKARDNVKAKIKTDFAVATQHSASIKDTTTSVHASTVKTVEAQMVHLNAQLHSLDDIVSRIRAQNNAHHTTHTVSLNALSSTVQSSYSSIGDHLSTSFARVQSLESDVAAQTTALKDTLLTLSEDSSIRTPLHELRDSISNQSLMEYSSTGETPQKTSYTVPSTLPRTDSQETILSHLRDRPASTDTVRSPTKGHVFNDATNTTLSDDNFFSSTMAKPNFSHSIITNTHSVPGMAGHSLRELDVNIVSQDSLKSPPLVSPSEVVTGNGGGPPPLKKQNRGEDGGSSKLPMKKMGRKTVGGLGASQGPGDRENLTITNFSASVGPGVVGGRRLRSHGSSSSEMRRRLNDLDVDLWICGSVLGITTFLGYLISGRFAEVMFSAEFPRRCLDFMDCFSLSMNTP
ncbi:kinesin-domain-containing protein [Lindgomyces ingoldianus]|uniref:Kinesin-domain-containing protein n=1 Tax=Lindgomyces ingoldianus TaxID=673940 RepID=A0ACB6RBG2_9PLEO|nr:kinesin-domain-containing protein [Lindgomyces ingoldianus]KAF2476623.1 kinesin-domain-containing protein [Lindgomyces ingoldianus]